MKTTTNASNTTTAQNPAQNPAAPAPSFNADEATALLNRLEADAKTCSEGLKTCNELNQRMEARAAETRGILDEAPAPAPALRIATADDVKEVNRLFDALSKELYFDFNFKAVLLDTPDADRDALNRLVKRCREERAN